MANRVDEKIKENQQRVVDAVNDKKYSLMKGVFPNAHSINGPEQHPLVPTDVEPELDGKPVKIRLRESTVKLTPEIEKPIKIELTGEKRVRVRSIEH